MIKTDTGIITIAVEHYPGWFTADFPGHFQRFDGQSAVRRERHCPTYRFPCKQVENNGKVCSTFLRPDVRHVAAPYLIWLCHCELPPKVIRDSDMFTTTSFITVRRLLATDQSQFFHEPAGKPAPHSETSQGCHCGDASCPGRTMADVMQLKYLTA